MYDERTKRWTWTNNRRTVGHGRTKQLHCWTKDQVWDRASELCMCVSGFKLNIRGNKCVHLTICTHATMTALLSEYTKYDVCYLFGVWDGFSLSLSRIFLCVAFTFCPFSIRKSIGPDFSKLSSCASKMYTTIKSYVTTVSHQMLVVIVCKAYIRAHTLHVMHVQHRI